MSDFYFDRTSEKARDLLKLNFYYSFHFEIKLMQLTAVGLVLCMYNDIVM